MGSCWVGAFSEPTLRNLLKIQDGINLEVVLPIGYELIKGKTKQRHKFSLVNRLFFETWKNRFYKPIKKIRRGDVW